MATSPSSGVTYRFSFLGFVLLFILLLAAANSKKAGPWIVGGLVVIIVMILVFNYKTFLSTYFVKEESA